ncbi:MAG: hypothetical protein Kow006_13020 [Gammaproteobacteria bacterium]
MGEPKAIVDEELLKRFVPINALASSSVRQIAKKAVIAEYQPGDHLFRKGDRDGLTLYLLSGEIDLVAGGQSILVEAGSETARHPIGQHQPRQVDAVARGAVSCIQVETNIVDMVLTWQQSAVEVDEIEQDKSEDWMTRMLQNRLFLKLPPANIQKIMMSMSDMEVKEGDTIIRQGEEGDYYYYIRSGRCAVYRQPKPGAPEIKLAELPAGESFGEEALVSEERRNATVRMLTDGVLMRLSKKDFVKLIHDPLHAIVDYYKAELLASDGAAWLDVRLPDEFANSHINDAINIPLPTLRLQLKQLDKNRPYIVYCDTGRRSSTAAFLLSEQGFEAHVLGGGLMNLPPEVFLVSEHKEDANRARAGLVSSQVLKGGFKKEKPAEENREKTNPEPAKSPADKTRDEEGAVSPEAAKPKKAPPSESKKASAGSKALDALARARETLEQARRVKQRSSESADAPKAVDTASPRAPAAAGGDEQLAKALQEAEAARMLLEQELGRVEEELASSNSQLEEMLTENQRLEVQLARFEKESKSAEEERNRERSAANQELAALKSALQSAERERDGYRQKSEQTRQEIESARRELEELRGQLASLQKTRDRLEADLNAGRQDSEAATEQLRRERGELEQRIRSEGERHAEELAALKGQLESSRQARESAEQQLSRMDQELQQLKAGAEDQRSLREEVERLRAAAERQTQELTDLDGQLAAAREKSAAVEAERNELRQQLDRVAGDLESTRGLSEELTRLREALQTAEGRLAESDKARREAEERLAQSTASNEQELAEQQRTREELDFTQRTLTKALMDKEELERKLADAQSALEKEQELRRQLEEVSAERDDYRRRFEQADQERREAVEAAEQARVERKNRDAELKAELERLQTELNEYQERFAEAQRIKEEAEKARAEAEEKAGKAISQSEMRHQELEDQIREYQTVLARMEEELDQVGRITEEADSARKQSEGHVQRMAREMERLRNLLKEAEKEKDAAWQARKEAEQEIAQARREAVESIQKANEQVQKAQEDLARVRAETESEIQRRLELETNRFRARDVDAIPVEKETGPTFHGVSTRTEREVTLGSAERIRDTQTVTGRYKEQKKSNAGLIIFLILLTVAGVTGFVFKDQLLSMLGMAPLPPGAGAGSSSSPAVSGEGSAAATSAETSAPKPVTKPPAPAAPASRPNSVRQSTGVSPGKEIQDLLRGGGLAPVVVQLPGGRFLMGDETSTDSSVRPQHAVTVKPFAIGKFEVTFEDYERFAQATGREVPDDQGRGRGKNPVVNVSWNDARAYAVWLSEQTGHLYRLPSEAEWEYAARAGKSSAYWWGNAVGNSNANCFNCGSEWDGLKPAPVGSFPANAFGIHDTAGNVAEWTQDCYQPTYQGAPADGSAWESGACVERVVRGGSFASSSKALRSANRERFSMDTRLDNLGFRLVRER